jgi:hypothetical protein
MGCLSEKKTLRPKRTDKIDIVFNKPVSGIKVRPKCRLCEVTMFILTTGAGQQQVKAGRGQ